MVPGDIYIGKETLVRYSIIPEFHNMEYVGIALEHFDCSTVIFKIDETDEDYATPFDLLAIIIEHEKECPKKCPRPVSPAEDSSMTNAEIQGMKDAAVATGKFQVKENPSRFKGNPHEKIAGKTQVKDMK